MDETALFTSIPPVDGIAAVRSTLEKNDSWESRTPMTVDQIVELIDICLKTTYFSFMGKFFKQQHRCAMGSLVSPIVANLCMEAFEINALDSYSGTRLKLWLRYVDNTLAVLEREETDQFLQHLNSLDPNIKLTQENLTNIPYRSLISSSLSMNTVNQPNVYRKQTHTDQYLQFDSHHPLIHKLGVIRTLEHRANVVISETDEREKEKAHVKSSLRKCGYLEWAFQKAGVKSRRTNNTDRADKGQGRTTRANITIPFEAGISEKIKNAFKAHGISTCYKTQQSLGARMNQHRRPSSNPAQTSAVYTHLKSTGHAFTLKDVVVLDREEHWHRRGMKETIWERVENTSLNRKGGLRHSLSYTWDRRVRLIGSRLSRGTFCHVTSCQLPE